MNPTVFESVSLFGVGMIGVSAVMLAFAIVVRVYRTIDDRLNESRIRSYAEKLEAAGDEGAELNDELVAVLAAAAESIMQRAVTIRHIRFLTPAPGEGSWSRTGRVNIMTSHSVPKK